MSEWISIEDRLPAIGEWCCVLIDNRLNQMHNLFPWLCNPDLESTCASLRNIDSEGYAEWEQGRLASGHALRVVNNVTHWSPIPPIPEAQ